MSTTLVIIEVVLFFGIVLGWAFWELRKTDQARRSGEGESHKTDAASSPSEDSSDPPGHSNR